MAYLSGKINTATRANHTSLRNSHAYTVRCKIRN